MTSAECLERAHATYCLAQVIAACSRVGTRVKPMRVALHLGLDHGLAVVATRALARRGVLRAGFVHRMPTERDLLTLRAAEINIHATLSFRI